MSEEDAIALINCLLAAGLITQETLCKACGDNCSADRNYLQTLKSKEEVIRYLQCKDVLSDSNFRNVCANNKWNINVSATLEGLLACGFYSRRQRHNKRWYYFKGPFMELTTDKVITK